MALSLDYSNLIHRQQKTAILMALFGAIPLSIGKNLRQQFYRLILGKLDRDVDIEPAVQLVCAQSIELGYGVSICRHALLNCWDAGSKLILHDKVRLDQGVHIQAIGGTITIGKHTYIGPYVCMAGPGNIHIGQNCLIASGSGIYANNHIFDNPTRPINQQGVRCEGIVIEDDCWLGSGVRVLDGVTIGEGSVIGAGAVVTKDIPPYSVAVGVPAKVVSKRGARQRFQASVGVEMEV
ncbi:acyltransferase [Thermocoleostomius sinensis]|jgi:acetyltransferase-like isoleucine patch superfamily enzyme|uniref:acyltransferase n=1 Tax=Thermocoleostomius sinensis TaxID=3065396 RepID=UPI0025B63143|nr:DapH/DapD/GlmU-related protein [Thermocoleostomius sinensis]